MHVSMKQMAIGKICVGAMLVSLSAIATAGVEYIDGVPAVRVNYADLDLARGAGAVALYSRIKSAATKVCEPLVPTSLQSAWLRDYGCEEDAVARAVVDVNSPVLTQYHKSKADKF